MASFKYNIDILVAADNINVLNAMEQLLPNIDDPRLWPIEYNLKIAEYSEPIDVISFEGANILKGHICFEVENEKDSIIAAINGAQGIFNQCRENSYILEVLSDHEFPTLDRTGSKRIKQRGIDSIGTYIENFIDNISQGRDY